jgi:hypothetical protein
LLYIEVKFVFHIKGTTEFEDIGEEVQTKKICIYEVGRGRRELHNENFHDLHCSESFMTVIIPRRMKEADACCKIWQEEACMRGFDG